MMNALGDRGNSKVRVFFAWEIAISFREANYEDVTVTTRLEGVSTKEVPSDIDCEYFYLSSNEKQGKSDQAKFDLVNLSTHLETVVK